MPAHLHSRPFRPGAIRADPVEEKLVPFGLEPGRCLLAGLQRAAGQLKKSVADPAMEIMVVSLATLFMEGSQRGFPSRGV